MVYFIGQRCIEAEQAERIPITVDILRSCSPSTGFRIVHTAVADAILRCREIDVRHNTALLFGIIRIIEKSHAVREGRLQARLPIRTFCGLELSTIGNRFSILGWLLRPRYVIRSWLTLEKRRRKSRFGAKLNTLRVVSII